MRINLPRAIGATGRIAIFVPAFVFSCLSAGVLVDPQGVEFSQPAASVEAYDYVEIAATVDQPDAVNPFTDASLSGSFRTRDGSKTWNIEGFCDSADGGIFRIRFMPTQPGDYSYAVTYKQGAFRERQKESFRRRMGIAAARLPSIRSIPGILSGPGQASITSSMEPRPTGWWAGATIM